MDFFPARKHSQSPDADTELTVQLGELRDRLAECQRDAAQSRVEMQARLQELEDQLSIRQTLNDRQRSDIEALEEQLERLKLAQAQDCRQHNERMVQVKVELQDAKDVAQKRVEALQRFKAELSLSRTTATEAEQKFNSLNQQYLGEKAHWVDQKEMLEARLAGYEETEAEAVQRWQEEREAHEQAVAELDLQTQTARERAEELQARLEDSETCHAAIQADLASAQSELTSTQTERDELLERVQSLEDHVAELEPQVKASEEAALTQEQVHAAEQQVTDLQDRLNDNCRDLQQLEAEVASWKEKYATLQMHNMRLKKALERPSEEEREMASSAPAEVSIQATSTAQTGTTSRSGADLPRFIRSN